MITINADTKISTVLKAHAGALDAIVQLSPAFEKLRNPFLRQILASKASIRMAAKMGNCSVTKFLKRLEEIGFDVSEDLHVIQPVERVANKPFKSVAVSVRDLDVREIIHDNGNPLPMILTEIYKIKSGEALRVINSFEPIPLIQLLEKKGFYATTESMSPNLFYTTFYRSEKDLSNKTDALEKVDETIWSAILATTEETETLDVRDLPMPKPMTAILAKLANLKEGRVLHVFHKKVPLLLLPELVERSFEYRIRQLSNDEVHMLIFKSLKSNK